jgi:hypothetical protein
MAEIPKKMQPRSSGLDSSRVVLTWLAALVGLDAPSESYLMNLDTSQAGVTLDRPHRVLAAQAPIVGTPRVVSASSKISDVLRAGV